MVGSGRYISHEGAGDPPHAEIPSLFLPWIADETFNFRVWLDWNYSEVQTGTGEGNVFGGWGMGEGDEHLESPLAVSVVYSLVVWVEVGTNRHEVF